MKRKEFLDMKNIIMEINLVIEQFLVNKLSRRFNRIKERISEQEDRFELFKMFW